MKNVDKVHKDVKFLLSEALKLLFKFNNNILQASMTQSSCCLLCGVSFFIPNIYDDQVFSSLNSYALEED